ncbi:MAG: serine/threonine protein kinase, partial [Gemmatimonadota bacterium]|nr:serine/threonine protein kinase [Gemmatimonadota bacterium]
MSGIEGLLAGRVLGGRYHVEAVVGRGGMGAVYRAVDQRLGRPVALKVIIVHAPDAAARERLRQRFHREAQSAARLRHPNVVVVHDFGTDPELDLDYLVMELLDGEDLAALLAREGAPPLATSLEILDQAARGLGAGHRAGLVHRDVKPGNLFLARGERGEEVRVRVLDFGIAQLAEEEDTLTHLTVAGGGPLSPAYASPEQLSGGIRLTPASDVFSLAVVGLQLATGEKLLSGAGVDRSAQIAEGLRRLSDVGVGPDVSEVLGRSLLENPAARPADAHAFREELR